MLHVWVDAWQMQCCGDPFGVRDTVRWALQEDHLEELLRDDAGVTETLHLTHREEHHGGAADDTPLTAGVVRRVRAVFFEYVEDPEQARMTMRAAGSGRARERLGRVDGWEPGDSPPGEGPQLDGYVVVLEPVGG